MPEENINATPEVKPITETGQTPKTPLRLGILIAILLATSLAGGIYLYAFRDSQTSSTTEPLNEDQTEMPSASASAEIQTVDSQSLDPYFKADFAQRMYGKDDKLLKNQAFPKEMTSIKDEDLVALRCTPRYSETFDYEKASPDGPFLVYDNEISETVKINELIKGYRERLRDSFKKQVDAFIICDTNQGRRLVEYENWGSDTGTTVKRIAEISSPTEIASLAEVTIPFPYFACFEPLMLTKQDIFYFSCPIEENGFSFNSVYRVNLKNKENRKLIECSSGRDNDTGKEVFECK